MLGKPLHVLKMERAQYEPLAKLLSVGVTGLEAKYHWHHRRER